jgi:ATP-dependent Clp protease ATP-binding subunit ClpC
MDTPPDDPKVDRELLPVDVSTPSRAVREIEEYLSQRTIGQPRAIDSLLPELETDAAGLILPGEFMTRKLFAGPPGSGKTQLGYELGYGWIGYQRHDFHGNLIEPATVINCPEFIDRHDVATLRGSTKGYVGYDDDTPLMQRNLDKYHTEILLINMISQLDRERRKRGILKKGKAVEELEEETARDTIREQHRPLKKVLILDEIERGHRSLHNFALSIMNGKPLVFTNDETTDLTRTALIMTSNVGERRIQEYLKGGGIGFKSDWRDRDPDKVDQDIYDIVKQEIRETFSAAFVSRIRDDIVVFRPLHQEHWAKILDLRLEEIRTMFTVGNEHAPVLRLHFTPECRAYLLKRGIDPLDGARPMRQLIRKRILGALARGINTKQFRPEEDLVFDVEPKPTPHIVLYKDK